MYTQHDVGQPFLDKLRTEQVVYLGGELIEALGQLDALMPCLVSVGAIKGFRSISSRHQVQHLVVPSVAHLNFIPAILLLHALPLFRLQICKESTGERRRHLRVGLFERTSQFRGIKKRQDFCFPPT